MPATKHGEFWQDKGGYLQPIFSQSEPTTIQRHLAELRLIDSGFVPAQMESAVNKMATRIQQGGIFMTGKDAQGNLIAFDLSQFLPQLEQALQRSGFRSNYGEGLAIMNARTFFELLGSVNPGIEATIRGTKPDDVMVQGASVAIFNTRLASRLQVNAQGMVEPRGIDLQRFESFSKTAARAFEGPDYFGQQLTTLRRSTRSNLTPAALLKVALAAAIPHARPLAEQPSFRKKPRR